jgi:hypothetical protein
MFAATTLKKLGIACSLVVAAVVMTPSVVKAWPEMGVPLGFVDPKTGKPVRGVRLLEGGGKPTPKKSTKQPPGKRPVSWDVF